MKIKKLKWGKTKHYDHVAISKNTSIRYDIWDKLKGLYHLYFDFNKGSDAEFEISNGFKSVSAAKRAATKHYKSIINGCIEEDEK